MLSQCSPASSCTACSSLLCAIFLALFICALPSSHMSFTKPTFATVRCYMTYTKSVGTFCAQVDPHTLYSECRILSNSEKDQTKSLYSDGTPFRRCTVQNLCVVGLPTTTYCIRRTPLTLCVIRPFMLIGARFGTKHSVLDVSNIFSVDLKR